MKEDWTEHEIMLSPLHDIILTNQRNIMSFTMHIRTQQEKLCNANEQIRF